MRAAGGSFDFSTMPDDEFGLLREGREEGESGEEGDGVVAAPSRTGDTTAHDRVFDKKTGRAAVRLECCPTYHPFIHNPTKPDAVRRRTDSCFMRRRATPRCA